MIYIGIDPGLKGSVAIIENDSIYLHRMPIYTYRNKNEVDGKQLFTLFYWLKDESCMVLIERARMMRGNSAKSATKTMRGYGKIIGILEALCIQFEEIEINQWKKKYGLGSDKEDSIAKAIELFPNINLTPGRCTKPQDGLAEALLLAELVRRSYNK